MLQFKLTIYSKLCKFAGISTDQIQMIFFLQLITKDLALQVLLTELVELLLVNMISKKKLDTIKW